MTQQVAALVSTDCAFSWVVERVVAASLTCCSNTSLGKGVVGGLATVNTSDVPLTVTARRTASNTVLPADAEGAAVTIATPPEQR